MPSPPQAILLDAMGTLIGFEPPVPRLQNELQARGHRVSTPRAERALKAEIRYYRSHMHEGRDAASLQRLRERCAAAMEPELPGIPRAVVLASLLAALRFFAYPDVVPALSALRAAGIRLVVVSNWDYSLHERLSQTGLAPLLDGAVASAVVGAAKPDPAIFARALELARTRHAWHVGDTPEADLDGARAAGLHGILLDRSGATPGALTSLLGLLPLAGC